MDVLGSSCCCDGDGDDDDDDVDKALVEHASDQTGMEIAGGGGVFWNTPVVGVMEEEELRGGGGVADMAWDVMGMVAVVVIMHIQIHHRHRHQHRNSNRSTASVTMKFIQNQQDELR